MTDLTLIPEIKPAINQIELHPYRQQSLQRENSDHLKIAVEALGPFNQVKDNIFNDSTLILLRKNMENRFLE